MYVPVCIYVYLCIKVPAEARRGCVSSSGSSIILDRELPSVGGWAPNPGPLGEQQVLLAAEAPPQPWHALCFIQYDWVLTVVGPSHSTRGTAGRALQLRWFLQGCFRGPRC